MIAQIKTGTAGLLVKVLLMLLFIFHAKEIPAGNYYWVGGTGNWNDFAGHWATSSGGQVFHIQAPTPDDTVYFDSLSFSGPDTVFCDTNMLYCAKMVWHHPAYHPTLMSQYNSPNNILRIYGSMRTS